jgi:hypothetical protein
MDRQAEYPANGDLLAVLNSAYYLCQNRTTPVTPFSALQGTEFSLPAEFQTFYLAEAPWIGPSKDPANGGLLNIVNSR